jgi:hypothetical protein
MHCLLYVPDTDLVLHINAGTVLLKQALDPIIDEAGRERPQFAALGELTREQVSALRYHLDYWAGAARPAEPQRARGIVYDY